MNILHVAQVDIGRESGMGRVAWHWRAELERRGHRFVHIGREPLGRPVHPAWYPMAARTAARRAGFRPDVILAHEPAAAAFAFCRTPLIAFSHGIERRGWMAARRDRELSGETIALRSRILFPVWRLLPCDIGLRRATGVLVLNREDRDYCLAHYGRKAESTFLFRNGVEAVAPERKAGSSGEPVVLFLGSWIARKGIRTLVDAATLLRDRDLRPRWLLAGTGMPAGQVLAQWPEDLRANVEVVAAFDSRDERDVLERATVFVLPSFFEGQPLGLLQAMAHGLAVVATDTCGQRDLVQHEESGLLFPAGDARRLAGLLERCLREPALRQRLGAAAARAVAGRSWQAVSAEVADFIERVQAKLAKDRG